MFDIHRGPLMAHGVVMTKTWSHGFLATL